LVVARRPVLGVAMSGLGKCFRDQDASSLAYGLNNSLQGSLSHKLRTLLTYEIRLQLRDALWDRLVSRRRLE